MMTLPSYSPAKVDNSICRIDRKFHTGTCAYASALNVEIVVIVPELQEQDPQMDFLDVAVDKTPYRIETVRCDGNYRLEAPEVERVEKLVRESTMVYGTGLQTSEFARKYAIPYVPIVEYNLRTNLVIARLSTPSLLRKVSRTLKTYAHFLKEIRTLKAAHSVHCNGYPVYKEAKRFNPDSLLYFDSRMSADMVIDEDQLARRLAQLRSGRRPRLIYSGRYESLKGAADVVEVGVELMRLGSNAEVHLYGKGAQASAMITRVRATNASDHIFVHDAVPYPELVEISQSSDLFVSCHVQDDPSCTYLEAFGCGLPIVGYANAMWKDLAQESEAGLATPLRDPVACGWAIFKLLQDPDRLYQCAIRAREFAIEHSFEREFAKRIDGIRGLCGSIQ